MSEQITYHPGHPAVPRPGDAELVELAVQVCHAIEACGASPELTHAVTLAGHLVAYLQKPGRTESGLSFGLAIEAMKQGRRVARAGWNGKGMWLCLVEYSCNEAPEEHPHYHHHGVADVTGLPWIGMKTADDHFVPWLASQTDMLADDWVLV